MAVVVKIHEARVDYENADKIREGGGILAVYQGTKLVGLHNEWRYAAIKPSQCKRGLLAELLAACNE